MLGKKSFAWRTLLTISVGSLVSFFLLLIGEGIQLFYRKEWFYYPLETAALHAEVVVVVGKKGTRVTTSSALFQKKSTTM